MMVMWGGNHTRGNNIWAFDIEGARKVFEDETSGLLGLYPDDTAINTGFSIVAQPRNLGEGAFRSLWGIVRLLGVRNPLGAVIFGDINIRDNIATSYMNYVKQELNKSKLIQLAEKLITQETLEGNGLEKIFNELTVPKIRKKLRKTTTLAPVKPKAETERAPRPKKTPAVPRLVPKQTPALPD